MTICRIATDRSRATAFIRGMCGATILCLSTSLVALPASAKDIVIHAGTLLDEVTDAPKHNVSVVIHDDRIVSIQTGFVSPVGAEIVDLSRFTVLPGLIDCHVHITSQKKKGDAIAFRVTHSPMDLALGAVGAAQRTLNAGFTTIRNLGAPAGSDVALKRAIAEGLVPGPRMWVSMDQLGPTGGHSDPSNGLDAALEDESWRHAVVDGQDQAITEVRRHRKLGADLIKIMPSGGVTSIGDDPRKETMTPDEMSAVIETAHSLGMKVAAHAHGKKAIDDATRLGVDSIEHGSLADAESLRLMKAHGTYLVSTLLVAYTASAVARTHPELLNPSAAAKALEVSPHTIALLGEAYRAGVKIAFGTDTNGLSDHGNNAREFALLVKGGMSPAAAIAAATRNAADLLGAAGEIGQVKAGAYADLIAVAGNPLTDVTELERVQFVMKGGELIRSSVK